MSDWREVARKCLKRGINVVPLLYDKTPAVPLLEPYFNNFITEEEIDKYFDEAESIGWITGNISNLTLLDFDLKYETREKSIYEDFVEAIPNDLFKRLLPVKTRNNGYHLWVRNHRETTSKRLARRYTSFQEKIQTYYKVKGKGEPDDIAGRAAEQDRFRVLLETREQRGYGVAYFDPDYTLVEGHELGVVSKDELNFLIDKAKEFDRTYEVSASKTYYKNKKVFDEFNKSVDFVAMMHDYGWEKTFEKEDEIRFVRPGDTVSSSSANFHKEFRTFTCFSTSAVFPVYKPMPPHVVLAHLECRGNEHEVIKKIKKYYDE